MGAGQFAAIDALSAEETNLADELRGAIADGDRGSLVQLLAALGLFWTMRGEHLRLVVLARAVAEAVRGWLPPPDLADAARAAVAITMNNSMMIGGGEADGPLMALLRQLGPDPGGNVYLSGLVRVLLAYDSADIGSFPHRLAADAADWAGTPGLRSGWRRSPPTPTGTRRPPPASGSVTSARTPAIQPARSRPPSAYWLSSATRTARGLARCRTACWPS